MTFAAPTAFPRLLGPTGSSGSARVGAAVGGRPTLSRRTILALITVTSMGSNLTKKLTRKSSSPTDPRSSSRHHRFHLANGVPVRRARRVRRTQRGCEASSASAVPGITTRNVAPELRSARLFGRVPPISARQPWVNGSSSSSSMASPGQLNHVVCGRLQAQTRTRRCRDYQRSLTIGGGNEPNNRDLPQWRDDKVGNRDNIQDRLVIANSVAPDFQTAQDIVSLRNADRISDARISDNNLAVGTLDLMDPSPGRTGTPEEEGCRKSQRT